MSAIGGKSRHRRDIAEETPYGLVIESVLDERMFECSFSFMKSLLVSSQRKLWYGLNERKIAYFKTGFLDWSNWVALRDATPVQYWIQIGFQIIALVACLIVAIFGWWRPNT